MSNAERDDASMGGTQKLSASPDVPEDGAQATQALPIQKPRRRAPRVLAIAGWGVFILTALFAIVPWLGSHRRVLAIDQMMTDPTAQSVSLGLIYFGIFSTFGLFSLLMGLVIFIWSRFTAGRTLIALSLLGIASTVVGLGRPTTAGLGNTTNTQARQALKDLSHLVDGVASPAGKTQAIDQTPLASESKHGNLAYVVKTTQDLMTGILADAKEYQSGTLDLQMQSLLLPTKLGTIEGINESKAKVLAAQGMLKKYRSAIDDRLTSARASFASAPYDERTRTQLLREFEGGISVTFPLSQKVLEYETAMYAEVTELLDFMLAEQGKFHLKGNKLLFESADDVAIYNASLSRYRGIAAKQIALRERLQGITRSSADRMRKMAEGGPKTDPFADVDRPASASMKIELTADGIMINNKPVILPMPVKEFEEILGAAASRTVGHDRLTRVWDELGVFATGDPGEDRIDAIGIQLNNLSGGEASPTSEFAGRITLDSVEVSDVDTPRSLNRSLKDHPFIQESVVDRLWLIEFPAYRVLMIDDKSAGLCDALRLQSQRPAAPKAKDRKPKF